MLHIPKKICLRTERVLSTVAFAVLLGIWMGVYAIVMPADPIPHRHVATLVLR